MYYEIADLCPRTDISLGRHGFTIKLHPEWRELVAGCSLDEQRVQSVVRSTGRHWLDACGFGQVFDPDRCCCGCDTDHTKPLGPNARKRYDASAIRVRWGEWGVEYIGIPGNACELYLNEGLAAPRRGKVLEPHNIDTLNQKLLLLVIFTWFSEFITVEYLGSR